MRAWLVVACADHVARGQREGIVQACHGKAAPLRCMDPGDLVVTYSPTQAFGGGPKLQAFTALGVVAEGEPYPFDMGGGFVPWRRNMRWLAKGLVPRSDLQEKLELTQALHWGYRLRQGHLPLTLADAALVAQAMGVVLPG